MLGISRSPALLQNSGTERALNFDVPPLRDVRIHGNGKAPLSVDPPLRRVLSKLDRSNSPNVSVLWVLNTITRLIIGRTSTKNKEQTQHCTVDNQLITLTRWGYLTSPHKMFPLSGIQNHKTINWYNNSIVRTSRNVK
jgi:hypothetical protein